VSLTLIGERGDKLEITDESGDYRFVGVIPGDYTLTPRLRGLGKVRAEVHAVACDRKELNVTLQAAIEGEATVTGEPPTVGKLNVSAGAMVSDEIGERIGGTTRTCHGIVNAIPGVTATLRTTTSSKPGPPSTAPTSPTRACSSTGVSFNLRALGTQGRFTSDEYSLNLNGAWRFPRGLPGRAG